MRTMKSPLNSAPRISARLHPNVSLTVAGCLIGVGDLEADQAVDHFQFVRLVNEHYDYADKVELVELMWQLAYADEQLDALEEHRIRKLADLLFVRHSDFIRTKLRVQEGRDGAQP